MKTFTLTEMAPGVHPVEGEALRFRVTSHSNPGLEHLVDLSAYSGAGRCSCEDFTCRHNPKLRAGMRPLPYLECRHIKRARRYLALEVSQTIIKQRKDQANENRKKYGKRAVPTDQEAPQC